MTGPFESDEEEYDSELDDFIDDGPEEGNDYSKYIQEIFGYDKSRYRRIESDDEDDCMETSYAQQMKEERISTKIGRRIALPFREIRRAGTCLLDRFIDPCILSIEQVSWRTWKISNARSKKRNRKL